jgi:hypothetical protein
VRARGERRCECEVSKLREKLVNRTSDTMGKLTGESRYGLRCNRDRSLDVIFNSDRLIV